MEQVFQSIGGWKELVLSGIGEHSVCDNKTGMGNEERERSIGFEKIVKQDVLKI
jgi:hypothetical protein